ncbi:MAG: sulfate transporter CysZ [Gammaproteobacteria bacterium]
MSDLSIDTMKGGNTFFAAKCFFKGLKMLTRPELRQFLVIPVMVNVILFTTAFVLGILYVSILIEGFIPDWLDWLRWLIWPLFLLSFFMVGFFTFTMLANVLAAPFYGRLSAKTMTLLTGKQTPRIYEQPFSKSIFSELKRLGYLTTRALPLLLVFMIPGVNLLASVLWALFGAWSMVLEYMAYPLENEGLLFTEQRGLIKRIRIGTLGFGGIAIAGLTIPIVNILIPPAAVIGATIFIHEIKNEDG